MSIVQKHKEALDVLLNYKKEEPRFTFQLRKKNTRNRLERGYYFLGNDGYIFIGFYKVGCKDNKTNSIGFVDYQEKQYIEIVYRNLINFTEKESSFYDEVIKLLRLDSNLNVTEKKQKQYWFYFERNDFKNNLIYFIKNLKPKIDELIHKYKLEDKYFSTEKEFQSVLKRVLKIDKNITANKWEAKMINYKTKNTILYGVPGVGKTHNVKNIISMYESGINEKEIFAKIEKNIEFSDDVELPNDRVEFITFHQSFAYEDFIEGFRPDDSGKIILQDGIFKNICDKARDDKENNYYLVIDEINRGNISKIFGELITLIEEDKREVFEVKLPYSKEPFSIPKNLFIIATMNSTDKSIALIDIALRRRFIFLKLKPNLELIKWEKARELLKKLNESLDSERVIGHSYFMDVTNQEDLEFVLRYKITPLLEEYFYGDENKLDEIKSTYESML
jgi:5-methylcytosine-specific restriction protein B